jgi:predicted amidohydrolase
MTIRIAAIQPRTFSGADEVKNLDACLDYIDQAADAGAKFVCLPEMYPGPVHPSIDFDTTALYDKAAERRVYVIRGKRVPAGDQHNVCAEVIGPDGKSVGLYGRTTPVGPYIYQDLEAWSIDYAPADGLPVFDTEFGKIGVLICSEVYVPELTRVLVLAGAKIIFFPSGGHINELMGTWKIMLQARAIENLIYTAACQNMYGVEEGGEAVIIADLDMERLEWLRDEDEKLEMPKKYRVVPGTLRWRRPDLYGPLVAPSPQG